MASISGRIERKKNSIRKLFQPELLYYWSIISFDITEPLLVIETKKRNYILNFMLSNGKLTLFWLDESRIQL